MIACHCTPRHDGSPCLCGCHTHGLPHDVLDDLAVIAARRVDGVRYGRGMYADDTRPMTFASWAPDGGRVENVTPWRIAMEVD